MKRYTIFIKSAEHPRTCNTFRCARINFSMIKVEGRAALEETVAALRASGEVISEIRTDLGAWVYL